jgi:hypothetical protein
LGLSDEICFLPQLTGLVKKAQVWQTFAFAVLVLATNLTQLCILVKMTV